MLPAHQHSNDTYIPKLTWFALSQKSYGFISLFASCITALGTVCCGDRQEMQLGSRGKGLTMMHKYPSDKLSSLWPSFPWLQNQAIFTVIKLFAFLQMHLCKCSSTGMSSFENMLSPLSWHFITMHSKSTDSHANTHWFFSSLQILLEIYSCWWSCKRKKHRVDSLGEKALSTRSADGGKVFWKTHFFQMYLGRLLSVM